MRRISLLALAVLFFVPAVHANEDSRVGSVLDRQGTALVRAVGRDRWTPIGPRSILMPGDQVRTPKRGANAVELQLVGKRSVVMGPGTLIEIADAETVKLYRGDVETKGALKLRGPGDYSVSASGTNLLRSDGRKTEILSAPPRWLTGYRSSTTDEWMGSLIATVDGRNVPLSVGYHKVTVDIRDQIARTTIEQSFVNSTKATLEGVFYFPLPADASISSFGMWIGGELVEADIVEKQRARAIYEDILRKRKDPGLLEWSGGNLFKARVFPIFPHSEKRIRIQYTQVLPLEGSTVRYRYALRSELLRKRPLRELSLKVRVSSSMPITSCESPSHEMRIRTTGNAASAEFDAEEFSPESDFELRIGLDRSRALSVVPHRRDEDGYFMVLLSPPTEAASGWQRELMPETDPLDLIVVADTSASMDVAARAAQADFIQALLALLGTKDRFRLMACDVKTHWLDPNALPITEENATAALDWLEGRASLGWTDLDLALADVRKVATDKSVVVYVGDGIGTTGDADPVALAARIRAAGKGVGHAIYTSSTYEKGVLEAIASIGGGSMRNGADDPVGAAYALLAESAQPAVKNLQVKFEGLRTARVYPERLPNLAAGTQQIVLGRFLPSGGDQTGKVTVTGTLEGKPVSYSANLTIKGGEAGNSFLPRLWARRHLDALLAQGRSPAIQKEIVAFSEEYGIMTPYTSFLVLESDQQREEYGVTRRVRMRDGERFFAEGRDNATTALLQQQMKLARTWRLRLRAAMLRQIATLGKQLHGQPGGPSNNAAIGLGGGAGGSWGGRKGGRSPAGPGYARSSVDKQAGEKFDRSMELGEGQAADDPAEDSISYEADFDVEEENSPAESPKMEEASRRRPAPAAKRRLRRSGRAFDARNNDEFLGRRSMRGTPFVRPPLFPPLASPAPQADPQPDPKWPAEVLKTLRSLNRRGSLAALPGGIRISQKADWRHAVNGHTTAEERANGLYGKAGWFLRTRGGSGPVYDRWVARDRYGILDVGLRLGRERDAAAADRTQWPFPLDDHSFENLLHTYRTYTAELKDGVVILKAPAPGRLELRLRIDPAKQVLTEWVTLARGKKTSTVRWSDFVEIGGAWWSLRMQQFDEKGRLVREITRTIESMNAASYAKALAEATAGHEDAILLPVTNPGVDEAKQAVHDKKAGFAEYFTIALHFANSQQWDRVFENWELAAALVPGKPGASWLRAEVLAQGRRGAEAKSLLAKLTPPAKGPAQHAVARHTLNVAQRIFQSNEMLTLVQTLKPALPNADYLRLWAQWLNATEQHDRALAIYQQLAQERPFDRNDVSAYIGALQQQWRHEEAMKVCETAVGRDKWLPGELDHLYVTWTNLLWQRRDVKRLHAVLERWVAARPELETAYQRFVSNLVFQGREAEADAWTAKQLAGEPGPAMGAAISYALGSGWNFRGSRLEEKWWKPLGDLGTRLIEGDDKAWATAQRILAHAQFMSTDAGVALRARLLANFTAEGSIESLSLDRIAQSMAILRWNRSAVDDATWRAVTDRMKARWQTASDDYARRLLAGYVLKLLDARGARDEAIAFVRTRKRTPAVTRTLMTRLMALEWTTAIEAELLGLLQGLQPEDMKPADRMTLAGNEVRNLVDRLEQMARKALLGPTAELEKLSRNERRLRERTARENARKALAGSLLAAQKSADEWSAPWMHLESLCLMAQTGIGDVNGQARELYASAKDRVLRERCAYVLEYIATRRKAPEGLADQVTAFLQAQKSDDIDWRTHIFRLLVALGENDKLQATLKTWISAADADNSWRIALGYLHAEAGQLDEAAAAFEAVARADELSAREYELLANWLLALDRKPAREKALYQRYVVMREQDLSQRVWNEYYQVANRRAGSPPKEFDPDTLRALRALLSKTSSPSNYTHLVHSLYRTIKDFRVLESLPYGVVGHTAQGIYPYLQRATSVIAGVHEEATCDELNARITELSETASSDLDRRALLLLRSLVERRASEVLNAPGPHVQRGVQAMNDAFAGSWLRGERRLMAAWLASLGKIPHEAFAKIQLKQLRELQRQEPAATLDWLWISQYRAQTLWNYGRATDAIDTLTVAIDAYEQAQPDGLRRPTWQLLSVLVNWLNTRGMHQVAETRLEAQLKSSRSRTGRMWLTQRLFDVYVHAARHNGRVSFGRGRALYEGARKRMEESMWNDGMDHVQSTASKYCELYRWSAKAGAVPNASGDLEFFTKKKLPELLSVVGPYRNNVVQIFANALRQQRNARVALELLITQIEQEPTWLSKTGRDGWRAHGWTLARWRSEAGDLGPLAPRLLKLATRALESDLLLLRSPQNAMYKNNTRFFWKEKFDSFRAVALKVVELNPDSAARLLHCARYLWNHLSARDDAIRVLLAADARKQLRRNGRWQLVQWMHATRRWKDSLPHLDQLLAERPDDLNYVLSRILALHRVGRNDESRAQLDSAEKRRKELKQWNESVIGAFARSASTCRFLNRAAAYYEELIPLHQRTHRNRGVGRGTLSGYYAELSKIYLALGETDKAVDAASAAVVSWGRSTRNRTQAIATLQAVLTGAQDLDGYVKRYEERVAKSGLDAPLIRKSIGGAYFSRRQPKLAIPHLLAARELQPNDDLVHKQLLAAYDALKEAPKAIEALMDSIRMSPLNLDLYADLGTRVEKQGDKATAERAWTSLVEVLPNEAASHRRLAEHRESRRDYTAATEQWRQVVRVRADESDGWLRLAKAQIAAGDQPGAKKTLNDVLARKWADTSVMEQAAALLRQIK